MKKLGIIAGVLFLGLVASIVSAQLTGLDRAPFSFSVGSADVEVSLSWLFMSDFDVPGVSGPTEDLGFDTIIPGSMTVRNNGTRDVRVSVFTQTIGSSILAQNLQLTIKEQVDLPCFPDNFALSGAVVYQGPLGNGEQLLMIGDPLAGQQPGDFFLAKPANGPGGEVKTFCLEVELPLEAKNQISVTLENLKMSGDFFAASEEILIVEP